MVLVVVEVEVVEVVVVVVVDSRGLCGNNGFVQILESPEVYKSHFPGLEGPGIVLVVESHRNVNSWCDKFLLVVSRRMEREASS